jgi:hypothetical protein
VQRIRPHLAQLLLALTACVVLALGLAGTAAAAGSIQRSGSDSVGFGVSPLRFDLDTAPGSSSTQTITITNTTTSASRYTFSKEDFSGDRDDPAATPVLLGGKLDTSISGYDWIELPDPVSIPAGESRAVKVKVNAPSGATGGHYAALLVTGEARSAGQVVAASRIGVLFSMNAGGTPPPEIVITEVQEVGPTRTVTRFVNEGTTTIDRPTGTITRDPVGPGDPRRIEGECTENVMPGAAGECVFEDVTAGEDEVFGIGPVEQYVDIVGDPGEEGTAARGDLPTEWAGTWTGLLLPLVGVALFVLYFLFLRRRRKGGEDEDSDLAWSGPTA